MSMLGTSIPPRVRLGQGADALRAGSLSPKRRACTAKRIKFTTSLSWHRQMPLTLEVAPLRPTSLGFGEARPAVLVFIRDPEAPIAVARLRERFGLTRTEAAVAAALVRGQSLEEIATAMHIGLGTVRTHLKRILSKTGTHRQAQAVALLARCIATSVTH